MYSYTFALFGQTVLEQVKLALKFNLKLNDFLNDLLPI